MSRQRNQTGRLLEGSNPLGWTPADFGARLIWWHDPTFGVALSSGLVTSWEDQSGNGNTVVPPTAPQRPLYVANWRNGLPAVSGVPGSQRFLERGAITQVSVPQPCTVCSMAELPLNPNGRLWVVNNTRLVGQQHVNTIRLQAGADIVTVSDAGYNSGVPFWSIAELLAGSGRFSVQANGVPFQQATGPLPDLPLELIEYLFNAQEWDAPLAECFAVEGALTPTEFTNVAAYFSTRGAIAP